MLVPELERQLAKLARADIVIGIPSYNNARTIGSVIEAVRDGLAKYFQPTRVVVLNSDAGSTDGTPKLIADAEWDVPRVLARHASPPGERVAIPYHGIPGRAGAQRMILEAAHHLEARACVLIEPDYRSLAPEWIERLLRPILEDGRDYVAPLFQRHRYDGTVTTLLLSPLMRAVYGKRIGQPLIGPNGLSANLVAHLCAQPVWGTDVVRQGVDLWMTVTAIMAGCRMCEAWLGPGRVDRQGRATDLSTTLIHVMGMVFPALERTADAWGEIRGSEPIPAVGASLPLGVGAIELNVARMIRGFRLGVKDLLPLWEQILASETLSDVLVLASAPDEVFAFPHELWARVVYDFAIAYHFRVLHGDHLLRALVPLYLGRTAAFVQETSRGGAGETEGWLERGRLAFERQKSHLVDQWR